MFYTKSELTDIATNLQCCASNYATQSLKSGIFQNKLEEKCAWNKALYIDKVACILKDYDPGGELISEGFISSAFLDLSDFAPLDWNLTGSITIAGVVVAFLPEADYVDFAGFLTGLETAINTGGSPYTATVVAGIGILINTSNPTAQANGFIIEVIINPLITASANAYPIWAYGDMTYIDDPNSNFYGMVAVPAMDSSTLPLPARPAIRLFQNGVEHPTSPIYFPSNDATIPPTPPYYPPSARIISGGVCHDTVNDRLYVTGYNGRIKYSYIDKFFNVGGLIVSPPNPLYPGAFLLSPQSVNASADIIYNPVDNCKYILAYMSAFNLNVLYKIDSADVVTAITNTFSGGLYLGVNPVNGDIWVLGAADIYIVNTAGTTIATTPVAGTPLDITYYPGTGVGTERMFVSVFNAGTNNSFVMSLEMNGTIDNASFYTTTTTFQTCRLIYSQRFNLFFINTEGITPGFLSTAVVRLNGTTKDVITSGSKPFGFSYVEDLNNSKVLMSLSYTAIPELTEADIVTFELSNEGEETFNGALEGGVDAVYTDGTNNCLLPEEITGLVEKVSSHCCDCCPEIKRLTINLEPPSPSAPIQTTLYDLYYGNNIANDLGKIDPLDLLTLFKVSRYGVAGVFNYYGIADSFLYFCSPVSLGAPSEFKDYITGNAISMEAPYIININSVPCNIFRSTNTYNNSISMEVLA